MSYHKLPEYEKLSKPHQDELCECRKKINEVNVGKVKKKKPITKFNNRTKKSITSDVKKQVTERMKYLYQEEDVGKEV